MQGLIEKQAMEKRIRERLAECYPENQRRGP
jgi:hypothetical protein